MPPPHSDSRRRSRGRALLAGILLFGLPWTIGETVLQLADEGLPAGAGPAVRRVAEVFGAHLIGGVAAGALFGAGMSRLGFPLDRAGRRRQ